MSEQTANRIRATVAGLCTGDGISWPAWWHRLNLLPPRRAVRLQQAHVHARDHLTSSLPTPYLHASAPDIIDPAGPTDDAEWFVVAVRHHLSQQLDGSPVDGQPEVWDQLAALRQSDPSAVRGRIGVSLSLANLTAGLRPPASGNDNAHWFDDLACVRAVAAGLLRPGAPQAAADLAQTDAMVTHAHDGVWGARAVAALIALLVSGTDRQAAITAACDQLPDGSWIADVVGECVAAATPDIPPLTLAAHLERGVVDHVYAYATQAPESVGLLLAHLAVADDANAMMVGALAHPRHADGLVALAGAASGAAFGGTESLPVLTGACIAPLAGIDMADIADLVIQRGRVSEDAQLDYAGKAR